MSNFIPNCHCVIKIRQNSSRVTKATSQNCQYSSQKCETFGQNIQVSQISQKNTLILGPNINKDGQIPGKLAILAETSSSQNCQQHSSQNVQTIFNLTKFSQISIQKRQISKKNHPCQPNFSPSFFPLASL